MSGDGSEEPQQPASLAVLPPPLPGKSSPPPLHENVLRLLECPVCMESMFPPIEQCVRGHSVCAECRLRITECPECKGQFSGTRCRRLEAICETVLPRPCRNAKHGCRTRLFVGSLPHHEVACAFRPCRCAVCNEHVVLQELQRHVSLRHRGNVLVAGAERFVHKDTPGSYSIYFVEEQGHYFWFWKRNGVRLVCMGVKQAAEDDLLSAHVCTVESTSADGKSFVSFSGPVHSASEHEDQASQSFCAKCVIVHKDFMKNGAKYSVRITTKDGVKII